MGRRLERVQMHLPCKVVAELSSYRLEGWRHFLGREREVRNE